MDITAQLVWCESVEFSWVWSLWSSYTAVNHCTLTDWKSVIRNWVVWRRGTYRVFLWHFDLRIDVECAQCSRHLQGGCDRSYSWRVWSLRKLAEKSRAINLTYSGCFYLGFLIFHLWSTLFFLSDGVISAQAFGGKERSEKIEFDELMTAGSDYAVCTAVAALAALNKLLTGELFVGYGEEYENK